MAISRFIVTLNANTQKTAEWCIGGKAATLARLAASPFAAMIPPWFALERTAFEQCLAASGANGNAKEVPHLTAEVTKALEKAVEQLAATLEPDTLFAVRSSAVGEDGVTASFAGQLCSVLNVAAKDIPAAVRTVWASTMQAGVARYLEHSGMAQKNLAPAVLVQAMVQADAAGVGFSVDPVSGNAGRMVISACHGLGEKLVSGQVNGDSWYCSLQGEVQERLCEGPPVVDDQNLARICALLRGLEEFFGTPQDAEWALAKGNLYLLQSRPITTLKNQVAIAAGTSKILWDNSNIVESYSGVTSPLTFSFARYIYEHVYIEFSRMLGVSEQLIHEKHTLFRNMLGSINGHVYYNLLHWYEWLTLFPGFSLNRGFMEQMMGVSEPLPEEFLARLTVPQQTVRSRIMAVLRLCRSGMGLLWNHIVLERKIKAFCQRLNNALALPAKALKTMPPDELCAHYRHLEKKLLRAWDAPLINDFLCMMAFGISRKLLQKYGGEAGLAYHRDMLIGQGDIISAEPARRIREMATLAAAHPALATTLALGNKEACRAALAEYPALAKQVDEYLERFGDRCLQELKLESPTMVDEPGTLYSSIGHLATRMGHAGQVEKQPENTALPLLASVIGKGALKNHMVARAAAWARRMVRNRENLRFERTRLFGRVRRIFVCMGQILAKLGRLDDPRDIFYLQVEEVMGMVEGAAVGTNTRELARLRKAEYLAMATLPEPPSRLVTTGAVFLAMPHAKQAAKASATAHTLQGIGCCRGTVRGKVRVILNPRGAELQSGEIMVARFTDPGWITLFANAAGILVERGSLLSHSAIVARELNIPAIVGLAGVTATLKTGDVVTMDGGLGIVRIEKENE